MKGIFRGTVNANVELGESSLVINGRPISLRALAAVSPDMLAVLEELSKPEANGGVYRIERWFDNDNDKGAPRVSLVKIGLMEHVGTKANGLLRRRR